MSCATQPKYYPEEAVRSVLTWPLVNAAVEAALVAVSSAQPAVAVAKTATAVGEEAIAEGSSSYASQPPRSATSVGNESGNLMFTMPAFVGQYSLGAAAHRDGHLHNTLACKLVTSFPGNRQRQPALPNIMANILLFESTTGRLKAILEATDITTWRTAAASVVATRHLYFRRRFGANADTVRAINVGIIGCGVQGQIHARAMCANFRVANIYLWNRTQARAAQLAEQLKLSAPPQSQVHVCTDASAAVAHADVICIATFAAEALISYADLQQQRQSLHINAIGAGQVHFGEVAQDIYDHADVYVDSMTNARHELKDLQAHIVGEVGAVIAQRDDGAGATRRISIFQSMGMAAEDACVGQAVLEALQCVGPAEQGVQQCE